MRFITKLSKEDADEDNDIASILKLEPKLQNGTLTIWQYPHKNDFTYDENDKDPSHASIDLDIPSLEQLKIEIDKLIVGIKKKEMDYLKEINESYRHHLDRDYNFNESDDLDNDIFDDDLKRYFSDSPDHRD